MKSGVSLLLLFIFPVLISAQVTQEWVQRYNGPANSSDIGRAMVIDIKGNLYVTGASIVSSGSSWDICTIKYNSSGVQQWSAVYAGSLSIEDGGFSIAVDQAGNVYVAGSVNGHLQNEDIITIKYNSMGIQQWAEMYNGPDSESDEPVSVAVDNSGNVYVTGRSIANLRNDYCTIKYSASGALQWVTRYDGPFHYNDIPYHLKLDQQNNVYITGTIDDLADTSNIGTIKYDSNGSLKWAAIYNGPANRRDAGRSVAIDNSGNVFVTGESMGNGSDFDAVTIKYDSIGSQIWVARYNGPGNYLDRGNSIGISLLDEIYVAGWSHGNGTLSDFFTIKYNQSGIEQWIQRYNGPGNDVDYTSPPNSLTIDIFGNAYITGWSKGIGSQYDYCTIKYNSSGEQIWLERYNGPGNNNDYGAAVAVDNFNNIYAFGSSWNITNDDYCLIKYSQLVGIQQISNEIPYEFNLYQNYPNPFNPTTVLKFEMSKEAFAKLIVYDIIGREIATLVKEKLSAGLYEAEWNAQNFTSGVYYYKLTAGDFNETKKMVLTK